MGEPTVESDWLADWLCRLGWLRPGPTPDEAAEALRSYQAFHGIREAGAGPVTARHFRLPRPCGRPDVTREAGPAWPGPLVKWSVVTDRIPPGLTSKAVHDVLCQAWWVWSGVCGLSPLWVPRPEDAHVVVSFDVLDGPGLVLGSTTSPAGTWDQRTLVLDAGETWLVDGPTTPGAFELGRVVLHEIGHAIGIPHLPAGNAMAPVYDPAMKRGLYAGDAAAARDRYGPSLVTG
jgi:hypothetical protein